MKEDLRMSVPGQFTGYDLSDITPLCMPWEEVNGLLQPAFSRDMAMLSLELAATAYNMDTDLWQKAGWRDFSYQVDNKLLTGQAVNNTEGGGPVDELMSEYYQQLAKMRLKRKNPISQIMGTLRQREGSDTCKALVMLHLLWSGQYLAAVGFMGTGKRVYDWISNFRVNRANQMHDGFLQLTKQFEENCEAIQFPETAKDLGVDRLTFADILKECRRPTSRFRIWMAGHSQGGAIMQLFAFLAIQRGVLRQNMIGVGFASPSVLYHHPPCELAAFPLFHIINADDVFPRTGALLHFGRCRIYYPDEEMRTRCYGHKGESEAFRALLAVTRNVTDSGGAFLTVLAVLLAIQDTAHGETLAALNRLMGSFLPNRILSAFSGRGDDLLRFLIRKVKQGYTLASGNETPPQQTLSALQYRVSLLIKAYGSKTFSMAFLSALALPHKLCGPVGTNALASYQYIVTERFGALQPKTWCAPASRMEPGVRSGIKHFPGRRAGLSRRTNRLAMQRQRRRNV